MLRSLLILCTVVLAPQALAAPTCQPTAVGTTWVYDEDGVETTEVITRSAVSGAETTVWVGRVGADGTVTPWEVLLVRDRSVYRLEREGVQDDPPLGLLVTPLREAARVAVPAGAFDAHPHTVRGTFAGPPGRAILVLDETRWYAPGVGVVRSRLGYRPDAGGAGLSVRVLKSFTPGKP